MYQTRLTKGQELVAQRMVKEFRRQGNDAYLITSIFHDWEPFSGRCWTTIGISLQGSVGT
jgi:D-inositol-3-phosphate glycosyltransferase